MPNSKRKLLKSGAGWPRTSPAGLRVVEIGCFQGNWFKQRPNDVIEHVADHEFGDAFERQTVNAGTETLLDSLNGAFNFANVTVSSDNVHSDRVDVVTKALKLIVTVDVAYSKTAGLV